MKEEEIRTLGRGDYFGEQALIRKDKRSANIIAMAPGVECLTLDREAFKQLIGNLEELQSKDYGDQDRLMKKIIDNRRRKLITETHSTPSSGELESLKLMRNKLNFQLLIIIFVLFFLFPLFLRYHLAVRRIRGR